MAIYEKGQSMPSDWKKGKMYAEGTSNGKKWGKGREKSGARCNATG